MAHWICWAIASEREFMVFVMVLVAAATFLAIGAIADWMSLPGPRLPSQPPVCNGSYRGISCRLRPSISDAIASPGDCRQNDPSSASALGAISDSFGAFHSGCNRRHRS